LSTDEIYYLKEIKIPYPKTNYGNNFTEEDYENIIK